MLGRRACLNFPALWIILIASRDSSIGVVGSGAWKK